MLKIMFAILALITTQVACTPFTHSKVLDNSHRTIFAWDTEIVPKSETAQKVSITKDHVFCIENITPIQVLDKTLADVIAQKLNDEGIPKSEVKIRIENIESAEKIYTVGEIMQFAQVSLYRLCEARANQFISDAQFDSLYSKTISITNGLLSNEQERTLRIEYLRAQSRAAFFDLKGDLMVAKAILQDREKQIQKIEELLRGKETLTKADTSNLVTLVKSGPSQADVQQTISNVQEKTNRVAETINPSTSEIVPTNAGDAGKVPTNAGDAGKVPTNAGDAGKVPTNAGDDVKG